LSEELRQQRQPGAGSQVTWTNLHKLTGDPSVLQKKVEMLSFIVEAADACEQHGMPVIYAVGRPADNPCPVMTSCDDGHQLQQIVCPLIKLDIDL
jgi:hypothetical protein